MKDVKEIYDQMLNEKYFSSKELIYDSKVGILMSHYEYQKLLSYKDKLIKNDERLIDLSELKVFNNYPLHFASTVELIFLENSLYKESVSDYRKNGKSLASRNIDEITMSRIYSEIEGTLNIEAVPTTRKVINEITRGIRKPSTNNEIIIKNMIDAIFYVNTCPEFNKENLHHLYNLLSENCLDDEDKLPSGSYYRNDGVEVANYKGCPSEMIEECMDSLFDFVNKNLDNANLLYYLPHIAHYYIVYIHPYFDYNGRTARMVSYWVALLTNSNLLPPIISEAINQTKGKYYYALSETRDSHNDLTYFLTYIYDLTIKYFLVYNDIEDISEELLNKGITLTNLEKNYFKKILISNNGNFTYIDFTNWIGIEMSKQGALKMLNTFEKYGLLKSAISNSNKKLFKVNNEYVKYDFKSL